MKTMTMFYCLVYTEVLWGKKTLFLVWVKLMGIDDKYDTSELHLNSNKIDTIKQMWHQTCLKTLGYNISNSYVVFSYNEPLFLPSGLVDIMKQVTDSTEQIDYFSQT